MHGNFYILVWKSLTDLCLYTFDALDQIMELICNLSIYDLNEEKCPVVKDPHSPGVIYANLKIGERMARTYVSFDNGKKFDPIRIEGQTSTCCNRNSFLEFDLICSNDLIKSNFPEKSIVIFRQKSRRSIVGTSDNIIYSINGGNSWKMVKQPIENLIIFNDNLFMFGTENWTGKIWYSYDQSKQWHSKRIGAHDVIDIIPIQFSYNSRYAAIDYYDNTRPCTFYIIDFSNSVGRFFHNDRTLYNFKKR
ncbi:hypothetical protein RF11_00433 [Thelohanellus kitauei]|uniref:Sortilin N-terminal domain-containing protein n=1 Tax=Thelohanellus kitauei TaxID=669202 RepID=A0A0C2IA88_THEKT|nr:hypothetical protein RF11_00433 [Thelohanellus kitauei]